MQVDTNLKKMSRLEDEITQLKKMLDTAMEENKKVTEESMIIKEKTIQTLNLTDQSISTILILKQENVNLRNEIEMLKKQIEGNK